jgi:hypothetical protein
MHGHNPDVTTAFADPKSQLPFATAGLIRVWAPPESPPEADHPTFSDWQNFI